MLVIGRVPARFLLPLAAAAVVSAPLLISLLRPYQVERLGSFLVGAHESPTGSGWALRQAHIALGSGGLFGRTDDPLRGLRAQYLPERDTDLALASLVGQWGLVAGAAVVLAAIDPGVAARAGQPGVPHAARSAGRRRAGGPAGHRDRGLGGRQPRAAPAGRRAVPAASATAARRSSCTWPRSGSFSPSAGTVPGGGCGRCRGGATRGRGWSGWPRSRSRRCWSPSGVYGWRLQTDAGRRLSRSSGDEQMTRCFRLPAARGVDHRPARACRWP